MLCAFVIETTFDDTAIKRINSGSVRLPGSTVETSGTGIIAGNVVRELIAALEVVDGGLRRQEVFVKASTMVAVHAIRCAMLDRMSI